MKTKSLLGSLLARKDIWRRIAIERLTEPLHLNAIAAVVALVGDTRLKIQFDLLVRQQHAYGLLAAADLAKSRGLSRVTAIELGVGGGTGLLNICELSERIRRETGVAFDVVGFDTGKGLPPPKDHRDHPELYRSGWFPMDVDAVRAALPANARLVLGDLSETTHDFIQTLDPQAPVGFVTLDVDFYSSSRAALELLKGNANCYLPYFPLYVDDIALPSNTQFAGELLAIKEFNDENAYRKIDFDWNLVHQRVFKHAEWLTHMYKVHVLDHAERNDLRHADVVIAPNPYLEKKRKGA
jgi:hypothetical protein